MPSWSDRIQSKNKTKLNTVLKTSALFRYLKKNVILFMQEEPKTKKKKKVKNARRLQFYSSVCIF